MKLGKHELMNFEIPKVGDDGILVEIEACGICGSDMHVYEGRYPADFPVIPGHEMVGKVIKLGKRANETMHIYPSGPLEEGDRVVVNPIVRCGKCFYCTTYPEHEELCTQVRAYSTLNCKEPPHLLGGCAEYMYILPGTSLVKISPDFSAFLAVLTEPLACAVTIVDRIARNGDPGLAGGSILGKKIVIQGLGPIGLLALAAFKLAGAHEIIGIDGIEYRLKMAREFGAKHTLDLNEVCQSKKRINQVRGIFSGIGADIVAECCGVPSAISEGLQMLRPGGKFIELGHLLAGTKAQIDPFLICRSELQIIGNYAYHSRAFLQALRMLKDNKLPYNRLTKSYALEEVERLIQDYYAKSAIKLVVIPHRS